jgi:hypothetical protein
MIVTVNEMKGAIMFGYTIDSAAAARRLSTGIFALILFGLSANLHAQSPLTVQPSTNRVGVNNTNPSTALDVTGTVKATAFQGDGSLLINVPGGSGGGSGNGAYGSRGQFSRNNAGTPDTQYDLKADVVILAKPSDQSTVTQFSPSTITNNVAQGGPVANGRDQSTAFSISSWVHFYWIWNGTALATISSASPPPTGPVLPSGYTHWAYASAVYHGGERLTVEAEYCIDLCK